MNKDPAVVHRSSLISEPTNLIPNLEIKGQNDKIMLYRQ